MVNRCLINQLPIYICTYFWGRKIKKIHWICRKLDRQKNFPRILQKSFSLCVHYRRSIMKMRVRERTPIGNEEPSKNKNHILLAVCSIKMWQFLSNQKATTHITTELFAYMHAFTCICFIYMMQLTSLIWLLNIV